MKLYRINKVNKPGGTVLKKKDVLAVSDGDAVQKAEDSEDCPVCDVLTGYRRPRTPGDDGGAFPRTLRQDVQFPLCSRAERPGWLRPHETVAPAAQFASFCRSCPVTNAPISGTVHRLRLMSVFDPNRT